MAWIRWRGTTAHLMVTEWVEGKSRQRYLGSLGGDYAVSNTTRSLFAARYPDLIIDWAAIDQTLAAGPPGSHPLSPDAWDWATVEHRLRDWADRPEASTQDRSTLVAAAYVLQRWRAQQDQS